VRKRRSSQLLAIAAGVVVAAGAITVGVDARRDGNLPTTALAAAGCRLETAPSQGREHVTSLPVGFHYNTFPPTSGPHAPTPAIWGAYASPVPELALVHNLEHGGIVVQYGSRVPRSTVVRILDWYHGSPDATVVAPLPKLGGKIALTAWTHLATCTRFQSESYDSFRDAYRFRGPEQLPLSALVPGS
jgi:hypothetical protein